MANPGYHSLIPTQNNYTFYFFYVTVIEQEDELSTVYTLPVESLEVGQTIGVVFRNPNDGWVGLTLVTENGDVVLRIAFVVKYEGLVNTLALYAGENYIWKNIVLVDNFPFPESGTTTTYLSTYQEYKEGPHLLQFGNL